MLQIFSSAVNPIDLLCLSDGHTLRTVLRSFGLCFVYVAEIVNIGSVMCVMLCARRICTAVSNTDPFSAVELRSCVKAEMDVLGSRP